MTSHDVSRNICADQRMPSRDYYVVANIVEWLDAPNDTECYFNDFNGFFSP